MIQLSSLRLVAARLGAATSRLRRLARRLARRARRGARAARLRLLAAARGGGGWLNGAARRGRLSARRRARALARAAARSGRASHARAAAAFRAAGRLLGRGAVAAAACVGAARAALGRAWPALRAGARIAPPWSTLRAAIRPDRAWSALRATTRPDRAVAALFLLGLAAPLWSPAAVNAVRDAFAPVVGVRAERAVLMLPPDAPTVWVGVREARARRAVPPDWVAEALRRSGPVSVGVALTEPVEIVEVAPVPFGSPYLAERRLAASLFAEDGLGRAEDDGYGEDGLGDGDGGFSGADVVSGLRRADDPRFAAVTPEAFVLQEAVAPEPAAAELDADASDGWAQALGLDGPLAEDGLDLLGSLETASVAPSAPIGPQRAPPRLAFAPRPRDRGPAPEAPLATGPRIAVVLSALGMNLAASEAALGRLPKAVAVAVPPVAPGSARWVARARDGGRLALAEIPMEPEAYPRLDPGDLTLLTSLSPADNLRRLRLALAKTPDADGVATFLGGRFTADAEALEPVLADLAERGLPVLETKKGPRSRLFRVARSVNLPASASAVALDGGGRSRDIGRALARLEKAAERDGYALGVGVAVPSTVAQLERWARTLQARGFRMVPPDL